MIASGGGEPGAVLPEPNRTRPEMVWAWGLGTTVQEGATTWLPSAISSSSRMYRPAGMAGGTVNDQAILAGAGSGSPVPPSVKRVVPGNGAGGPGPRVRPREREQRPLEQGPGVA